MRLLKYIFIGVIVCVIGSSCVSHLETENQKQTITLQSSNTNASPDLLSESKEIMVKRLKCLNINLFTIEQDNQKSQLTIKFDENVDIQYLAEMLPSLGKLNFLKTSSKDVMVSLINSDCIHRVDSLLGFSEKGKSYPADIVGYSKEKDTSSISSILSSGFIRSLLPSDIRFFWGKYPNGSGKFELYIVSSDDTGINETSLKSTCVSGDDKLYSISMTFKEETWSKWAELTKRNIGKSIVFVIDDRVYCAPVVQDAIKTGKAEITGDFSAKEANKLAAIIGSGRLPLTFLVR
ncbi:MAG: hypothetical protein HOO91_08710 [Bacteroidales bacterium]|nr:hypothetical protein [Bacteroidales bacterium]